MSTAAARADWRASSTLTVEQVAPILGIGRSAAYQGVHSGAIPAIRIGGRILVPVAALRRMLGEIPVNESSPSAATAGSIKTAGGISHDESYSH